MLYVAKVGTLNFAQGDNKATAKDVLSAAMLSLATFHAAGQRLWISAADIQVYQVEYGTDPGARRRLIPT